MITRYIISFLIVSLAGYFAINYSRIKKLTTEVENYEKAVVAYEALLKTKPFESKNKVKKETAKYDINKTLSSINIIDDGNYSL